VTTLLVVQPEAEIDVGEAFRWYEARREGLGHEFLEEASPVFARITEQPLRNVSIHRDVRRAFFRRFPYVALYAARDVKVYVLGVLHQRRNPVLARSRARNFKPE
jgi:plasmid stabilization system protein ParE